MKAILLILAAVFQASAATLTWNANTETNLAGYRIYAGRLSRQYNISTNSTTNTTFTLTNLTGTTFFAVTAFDTDGLESDFSNEVSYTKPNTPPRAPLNLRISGTNAVNTIKLLQSTDLTSGAWKETGQVFVPVSNGPTTYYKAVAPAPTKQFMSAKPPKAGKAITRNPPRPFVLPPMPPQ